MRDVTESEVVGLHSAVFGISIAEAQDRVSHLDGLEAAVVRPANYRHYRDADVAVQAAALAHGIAERQVFVDGKRCSRWSTSWRRTGSTPPRVTTTCTSG